MTPLTHAAVGMVLFQKLRLRRLRAFGWAVAFFAAFVSHYVLDAFPHFEDLGAFLNLPGQTLIYIGLGLLGILAALWLRRWNPQAALIWLVYCVWIGAGSRSYLLWRIPTAILAAGYLAYRTRSAEAVGYLLAGMLAVTADFLAFGWMGKLHGAMHAPQDWGLRLYVFFTDNEVPHSLASRFQSPYFLLGYGLELLVEAAILAGALYVFFSQNACWQEQPAQQADVTEPVGPTAGIV